MGSKAFKGEDVSDTLASVFRDDPDWTAIPDEVPARILQAIRVCVQKNAKERVRDIAAVRLAMKGAFETDGRAVEATTTEAPSRRRRIPLALASLALLVAGGAGVWMIIPEAVRPVGRFVVSTSPTGRFFGESNHPDLAISPDGTRICGSAARRHGALRTAGRPTRRDTEPLAVTGSGTPFVSPDGDWLGFSIFTDSSWKKVSIRGGPPVALWDAAAAPRGASWGPDGTIVFAQQAIGTGLFRGSVADSDPEVLTTPDATAGELFHWWPEFLPGGDAVLFTIVKSTSDQGRTSSK